jgi:hypothetical protein
MKTLTARIAHLYHVRGSGTHVVFHLKYRGQILEVFYGRDGQRMTKGIARYAAANGYTHIRWRGPAGYVPML